MRSNILLSILGMFLLLVCIMPASAAYAKSVYLIQLGSYPTRGDAEKRWQDVKEKQGESLGSLSLRVAEVALPPDNFVVYRTQAGPISTRSQAEDYCKKLGGAHIDCFVVETAMFVEDAPTVASALPLPKQEPIKLTPPPALAPVAHDVKVSSAERSVGDEFSSAMATPPAQVKPLATPIPPVGETPQPKAAAPVALAQAAPAPAQPTPQPFVNPEVIKAKQIAASSTVKPVPIVAGGPAPKGTVNVAEAIRVPLSDADKKATTKTRIIRAPYPVNKGYPSQNTLKRTLWAQIGYFDSRDEALAFWNNAQDRNPDATDGLRARITQPYLFARSGGHVSLNVGPFASSRDMIALCSAVGAGVESGGLRCQASQDAGSSTAANQPRSHAPSVGSSNYGAEAEATTRQQGYWLLLGSYRSRAVARERWDIIMESNSDLLRRYRPQVGAPDMSSSSTMVYRLQTGPLSSRAAADALCDELDRRDVACLVVEP